MRRTAVQDKIRGSLFGGAVGDALGYAVELWGKDRIFPATALGAYRNTT